jgi:hypothetical protein
MLQRMGRSCHVGLVLCLATLALAFSFANAVAGPCPTYSCGTGTMFNDSQ